MKMKKLVKKMKASAELMKTGKPMMPMVGDEMPMKKGGKMKKSK